MVWDIASDLSHVLDALDIKPEPWLPRYPIRILDGNCLEASEERLIFQVAIFISRSQFSGCKTSRQGREVRGIHCRLRQNGASGQRCSRR
jgi:hypothetical protein